MTSTSYGPPGTSAGRRAARHHHASGFVESSGPEAAALCEKAGLVLDGWQQDVLTDWLAEAEDGRWVHRTGTLIVPRQNGKSVVLIARMLAGLFLIPDERLILYSAHRFQTAQETWLALRSIVENTPMLRARLPRVGGIKNSHGEEGLVTVDGSRLRIVSRVNSSSSTGRGFSPDLVILDEALVLSEGSWAALKPAMAARPNPQVLVASSAGTASPESDVLRRLRETGRARQAAGFAFHEWCADVGDDRSDPATWAKANPGLPLRPTSDAVADELATMRPADFDRERLGLWDEAGQGAALDLEAYADCVAPRLERPRRATVSVDVHRRPGNDQAAAVVVSWQTDHAGPVRSVVVQSGPGVRWVATRVREVCQSLGVREVVMAVGGAKDVADEIAREGLVVRSLTLAELKSACMGLDESIRARGLQVQASAELGKAVAAAASKDYRDGSWHFDGAASQGSIAPVVAWAVGVWAELNSAPVDLSDAVW